MNFLTPLIAQLGQEFPDQGQGFAGLIDKLARTKLSTIVIICVVCTIIRLAITPYLTKTLPHLREMGGFKALKFLNEFLDAVVYAGIFVFLIIRPFVLQTFRIPTGSMVKTLLVGDFLIANKAIYRYTEPKVGDIIVFTPPKLALKQAGQVEQTDYIKRMVGGPGDVVEMKQNVLYRNGKKVNEPYRHYSRPADPQAWTFRALEEIEWQPSDIMDFKMISVRGETFPLLRFNSGLGYFNGSDQFTDEEFGRFWEQPAVKIPAGHYLMMGDNRNNSSDGRFWGLITRDAIVGRSEVILFPLSRMGRTQSQSGTPE